MNTTVECLGECKIDTHLNHVDWVKETERVLYSVSVEVVEECVQQGRSPFSFLKAGPRRKLYFDVSKLKCAIVTCGGLAQD